MGVAVGKVISFILLVSFVVASLAVYTMATLNIQQLIICSTNEDAMYIPKDVCKFYLHNFRENSEDIVYLENSSGIAYLFEIDPAEIKYELLEFFIKNGADVNHLNVIDGLTPLNTSILLNDYDLTKYLLLKGANPLLKEKNSGMTAYQFIELLSSNESKNIKDRSKIQTLLLSIREKSEK